jgi:hypothetical protein
MLIARDARALRLKVNWMAPNFTLILIPFQKTGLTFGCTRPLGYCDRFKACTI